MLTLNSVTFKDDETGKIVEVNFNENRVTSNRPFSADEYCFCNFHANLLLSSGIVAAKNLVKQKQN